MKKIIYKINGQERSREEFLDGAPGCPPGCAPRLLTDREFLEGHCNGSQFERTPWLGNYYKAQAESEGADVTGKVYLSALAEYPGDPAAWVSGRGDVQRVCEEKGFDCTGMVKVKAASRPGPTPERWNERPAAVPADD